MAMSLSRLSGLLGALALIAGCSSSSDSNTNGTAGAGGGGNSTVEIFSWWVAPGEADALQALIQLDATRHPGETILNAALASGENARMDLQTRLDAGDPPDLFQLNAHDMRAFLATNPNKLVALDEFYSMKIASGVIPDAVLAEAKDNGVTYAVPVNIHRENTLLYNKQVFADNNLTPPTTYAEFLSVCDALKAAGVTPVATVYQGWIQRILFNEIAMGTLGSKDFNDIITGAVAFDSAKWQMAIDAYANVLTNYVNSDANNAAYGWTDAADMVLSGNAAMFMHGDWAKGYMVQLGATPGVDFGVSAAPGATDMFWEDVDTFSMPTGAKNEAGGYNFLDTILSVEGQVAFNKLKGSTPIRSDIPKSDLDAEGQKTFDDLQAATYKTSVRNQDAWDMAFQTFTMDMDKAKLLQVYIDNPPIP